MQQQIEVLKKQVQRAERELSRSRSRSPGGRNVSASRHPSGLACNEGISMSQLSACVAAKSQNQRVRLSQLSEARLGANPASELHHRHHHVGPRHDDRQRDPSGHSGYRLGSQSNCTIEGSINSKKEKIAPQHDAQHI